MQTLTEIVADLDPVQRDHLSSLHLRLTNGTITAHLSISIFGPIGFGRGQYATVDTRDLPAGVTVSGVERHPDIVRVITMDVPLREQIAALHGSGIVGNLDWAAFDAGPDHMPGYWRYSWCIKTHAGSDAERRAWVARCVAAKKGTAR